LNAGVIPRLSWKRTCTALLLMAGLTACASGHSQSAVPFELHAASLTAQAGWRQAAVRDGGPDVYLAPQVLLSNSDIAKAEAKKDLSGLVTVTLDLTPTGTIRFAQAARVLQNQRMAVVVDGAVITAPLVSGLLGGNRFAVTGLASLEEAQQVARGITGKP